MRESPPACRPAAAAPRGSLCGTALALALGLWLAAAPGDTLAQGLDLGRLLGATDESAPAAEDPAPESALENAPGSAAGNDPENAPENAPVAGGVDPLGAVAVPADVGGLLAAPGDARCAGLSPDEAAKLGCAEGAASPLLADAASLPEEAAAAPAGPTGQAAQPSLPGDLLSGLLGGPVPVPAPDAAAGSAVGPAAGSVAGPGPGGQTAAAPEPPANASADPAGAAADPGPASGPASGGAGAFDLGAALGLGGGATAEPPADGTAAEATAETAAEATAGTAAEATAGTAAAAPAGPSTDAPAGPTGDAAPGAAAEAPARATAAAAAPGGDLGLRLGLNTPADPAPADRAPAGDPVADTASAVPGDGPLKRDDIPGLDRRILTLPGAALAPEPGAPGEPLPAFSVLYVYAEEEAPGARHLAVGRSATGGPAGWVAADATEDWRTMLVMEYAPKGARDRVLFFKRRDDLVQFVRDPHVTEEARLAHDAVAAGEVDGDYFVAIEPAVEVDPDAPYLMPILDSREDMFDSLDEVTLVEVAGLNLDAAAPVQADVSESESLEAPRRHSAMRDFRFGITFAIDTTVTMGRYIDHTRSVVYAVMRAFADAGLADRADFGLVGYRDNTGPNPAIEYVTRIFQPLDPDAPLEQVLANFDLMTPSPVSTRGFDEDAFAGLDAALNAMDWSRQDFRMVVLITDAGARRGTDPLAANPGYDVLNIRENADRLGVALAVVHLLTPEAEAAGNTAPAAEVYRAIAQTGDAATPKYFGVDTRDPDAFLAEIRSFADGLAAAVSESAAGRRVERREEVASLGDAVVNEVFRAQLEYLGAAQGQAAPRFYRAWAADRDLANPRLPALSVKVFLTRQQLSALMEGAEAILAAYEAQETGGGDFFQLMRSFSAQSSVEGAGSRPLAEAGRLFPSFLEALPYRSDFLALDPDTWSAGGPTLQRELTEALRNKLRAYRDIAASRTGWIDLGAGNRAEDVYAVGLELLP